MPREQPPFLSVVVARAEGGGDRLARTLAALEAQTLPREVFEVLVVGDAGTAEVARAFEARLPLTFVPEAHPGLAAARSRGTLLARGAVVLFVDAGDAPVPVLLEAHCDEHRRHPETTHAVLGSTAVAASLASDPLVRFVAEEEGAPLARGAASDGDVLDFTLFRAARASCKRALLADQALFDPALEAGCEDVELAWRLTARGLRLVYCARAATELARAIAFDAHCEEHRRRGCSQRALSRKHPDAALERWTDLDGARRLWSAAAPVHEALLRSARELDRGARLRLAAGLTVERWNVALLHRGYWSAFRASRARGAAEDALPLPPASARGAALHPRGVPACSGTS